MEMRERSFFKTVKKILGETCTKILSIDLTDDRYEVLSIEDLEWEEKSKESPTEKISDWFHWFANSPFCHEADRQRFREFTEIENLITLFESMDYAPVNLFYRRKFDLSDPVYSNVSMELYPDINESGHVTAFLFVRNITSEIQKNYKTIETGLSMSGLAAAKRTVLIIEDNDMNREMLAEILSDSYIVLQAENGAEGLKFLQDNIMDISLVVLDVQMPVMDGYEFLKITQRDPFLSQIPVVVATGSDSLEEECRCLELGATDFVIKPYNPDIIRSRIKGIIKLKESMATVAMLQVDERTGLYTLQAFYYYATQVIDQADDKSYSVTIFDIDNFKKINDVYGEQVGDKVLREIADVLKGYTAGAEIYARFGAARFLLLNEAMSEANTDVWIHTLLNKLQNACCIKGITFKAGIYIDVDKELPVSMICDRAISAMNSTESRIENRYAVYDETQAEKEHRLAIMETDMWEAYENEQFQVYYQPKHDANTGRLIGAEALIRWIHPQLGFLSPGEFISLFESNGFILYSDNYVLRRTCENLKRWMKEGIEVVPISVNSSRRNFEQENNIGTLSEVLNQNGVEPTLIHIEVTESLFSEHLDELSQQLQDARNLGISIELDDFGAGYSSLTTLASLPLDILKLDMSFMKNYMDEKKRKVLSTCINLAHSLGLKTVSEGVETEEQLTLLKSYGCDYIQGYYFSKPLPENDFKDYMIRCLKKN